MGGLVECQIRWAALLRLSQTGLRGSAVVSVQSRILFQFFFQERKSGCLGSSWILQEARNSLPIRVAPNDRKTILSHTLLPLEILTLSWSPLWLGQGQTLRRKRLSNAL